MWPKVTYYGITLIQSAYLISFPVKMQHFDLNHEPAFRVTWMTVTPYEFLVNYFLLNVKLKCRISSNLAPLWWCFCDFGASYKLTYLTAHISVFLARKVLANRKMKLLTDNSLNKLRHIDCQWSRRDQVERQWKFERNTCCSICWEYIGTVRLRHYSC